MIINRIFRSKTLDLFKVIQEEIGEGITDNLNYLYYPADSPLLLQAHMDTVSIITDGYKLYGNGNVITSNGVLGADDRAGVVALIELRARCISKKLPMPSLLFTNFEESGGKGMEVFLKTVEARDFDHIHLAIAIDRRGCNDYVTYVSLEKEVEKYIEKFGFIYASGSYSDIKEFSEMTEIPSVNLSAGYYGQHTQVERLHIDELYLTIGRVVKIIKDPIGTLYKCKKKTYKTWEYTHDDEEWDYISRSWVKKKKAKKQHINSRHRRWYEGEEEEVSELGLCEVCDAHALLEKIYVDGYQVKTCLGCKNILKPFH